MRSEIIRISSHVTIAIVGFSYLFECVKFQCIGIDLLGFRVDLIWVFENCLALNCFGAFFF